MHDEYKTIPLTLIMKLVRITFKFIPINSFSMFWLYIKMESLIQIWKARNFA